MNILKSMAYTAVAAVAAYNVYLAADIQQVKSDLTFDTIELTASGAEPGGDNSRIIDDSCSPGSPAWYAKMYGDSYGQSGGNFYYGRDPYCENALYGHDNNQSSGYLSCFYGASASTNSGVSSQNSVLNGVWCLMYEWTDNTTDPHTNEKIKVKYTRYACKSGGNDCEVGVPDRLDIEIQ